MNDTAKSPTPVRAGDHVHLVDGSGYIFRAYHALPPLTRPSDGLPIGAVHGFTAMLWKLLNDRSDDIPTPTHLAVVFDYSEKTFRNDLYKDYKAHRPDAPEDLVPQFPLIRDAVRAFNVSCVEQKGYEADDVIATYAKQAKAAGANVTIVSSDKDLMQLVEPGVVMFDPMKNRRIGEAEVIERFGVGPDKVIEVQALIGDSTDNVPGVPGIGVKTAAQLIGEYGDLETLLARASEIKQNKRRESLIQYADQARLSRNLVILDRNTPLDTPLGETAVRMPDPDALLGFLRTMEFPTLTRRIAEGLGVDAGPVASAEKTEYQKRYRGTPQPAAAIVGRSNGQQRALDGSATPAGLAESRLAAICNPAIAPASYPAITDAGLLAQFLDCTAETGLLALQLIASEPDPMRAEIVGIGLCVAPGAAAYLPLAHRPPDALDLVGGAAVAQVSMRAARDMLGAVFANDSVLKIGHAMKGDLNMLTRAGFAVASIDDIGLMSYALDAGRGDHTLAGLAKSMLGHDCMTLKSLTGSGRAAIAMPHVAIEQVTPFAAERADAVLRLWRALKPRLAAEHVTSVYETLERPILPVLADMEREGVSIDRTTLARLSGQFAEAIATAEKDVYRLAGEAFNIGSPRQLGEILFDKMSLPGGRRTKTGQWGTDAGQLEELAALGHDLPRRVLDWRQLTKLKGTYTDALPFHINPETGRVHTSYALASTSTGRLSSNDPNLQNIPVRTNEGRAIRKAFVAPKGKKLISADYSQIELRILAHMADIPALRQAFEDDLDIHAMTASEMFNVPIENMPGEVRRRAKAINFGIIYGISAFGLAAQLGIERGEAAAYINTYFERFPGIRDYMEATKAECRRQGFVTTLFGRKAYYPDINTKNPSLRGNYERAAINAPIQGSAADIIRRAMIRMPDALARAGLSSKMLLQVHDELVFEADESEVDETIAVARDVMANSPEPVLKLRVPLKVDAKAANDWEAAH